MSSSSQEAASLLANTDNHSNNNTAVLRRRSRLSMTVGSRPVSSGELGDLEDDVTPSDEYLLTMMRLRSRLRLKLLLVVCIAVLVAAFSFFVYPRQISYTTQNATLEEFYVREGTCALNFTSGNPLPINISDCVPSVTGHVDLTVRLQNDNYVSMLVHRYHAMIRFANLTLGDFTRTEPIVIEHGFRDVNQSVRLSSSYWGTNLTIFSAAVLSGLREAGKGHFAWQLIGEVDASVLGIPFNTTFNIPLFFGNLSLNNNEDNMQQ
jgi:hypothetical protein